MSDVIGSFVRKETVAHAEEEPDWQVNGEEAEDERPGKSWWQLLMWNGWQKLCSTALSNCDGWLSIQAQKHKNIAFVFSLAFIPQYKLSALTDTQTRKSLPLWQQWEGIKYWIKWAERTAVREGQICHTHKNTQGGNKPPIASLIFCCGSEKTINTQFTIHPWLI